MLSFLKCTHFTQIRCRALTLQFSMSYSLQIHKQANRILSTRGESKCTLTSECLVIFPPRLISKKRIHRNSATTTTPWRAPPLLQRRRAAPLTPPRPLPGVSLRRWAFLSPAVDGMERLPFRARAGRPSRRTPCPSEPHMPRCGGRSTASTPTRTPTAPSRANRSRARSTRSSSSSCRWLGPR